MDIIERIEIKHFRSFDGGKDQTKVRIDELKDLNIFSGANDSGKSNVLRALNLFFNKEISPGIKFDKDRDFSKIVAKRFDEDVALRKDAELERVKTLNKNGGSEKPKDLRRSDIVVSVKLFFNNKQKQRGLPKKFWVSRSFSQKNNFEGEYIYQTDLKGNAQVTLFISSFKFEYVPAVKDRVYFNHLFEKLQTYLFEKEDKKKENKFSQSSQRFNEILKSETVDLFKKFQKSSGVEANFYIPSTLVDFFRTLSVQTENNISLFDRGDGVQARFIPEILDEISKDSKKNIIWGFEEPENSYEVKNIHKLRNEFLDKYSKKKQIFITSHTKEFLSLKRVYTPQENQILENRLLNSITKKESEISKLRTDNRSSGISIYRVWKQSEINNTSLVTRFDEKNNEWEKTCDDLGIIQEARIIQNLQERLGLQTREIQKSKLTIANQKRVNDEIIRDIYKDMESNLSELEDVKMKIEEYEKPILVIEDKYDQIYKIAYLKIKDISFELQNLDDVFKSSSPFTIRRGEGASQVAGKLSMKNTDGYDEKKIIGLFDFDKAGTEKFYHLRKQKNWDDIIHGDFNTGIYKKRNQHPCFYALLLPVPERLNNLISDIKDGGFESFVEIENLLSKEILIDNNLVDKQKILTIKYLKIKETTKGKLAPILFSLTKDDFHDFIPLFEKVENLFKIKGSS